jgi:hypothetical protein
MGSSARPFSLDFVEVFRAFNNTTQQLPLLPPLLSISLHHSLPPMEETLEELDYELSDSPAEVRDRLTNALDINDEGMGGVNLYTVPDSMGAGTATAGDGEPVDPQLFHNGSPNLTSSTNVNLDSALAANPSHQSPATPGLSGGEPQSNLGTRTDDAVVPTPQQGILLEMLQCIVNCEVAAATQGQFISTRHQPPHPEALKNHPTLAKFKQMLDERIKAEDLPTYQKVQVEFSRLADAGESYGAVVDKCVVLFSQHMDEGKELALAEVQYAFFQLLQADGGLLGGGANAHLIFNKFVRAEASRTVLQYQDRFHDAVKMGARWQFSPFRKFRDLPPETRLMIWGYALGLDVPRIVRWGRDSCPAAAVLQACKEAFELWAKDYSIWRIKDNERIKVHFKDMDTYYFGDSIPILKRLYFDKWGPVPERMNLTNSSQVEWPHACKNTTLLLFQPWEDHERMKFSH